MQIERAMDRKGQHPQERKGQGVAAILTHGTYKEPGKQEQELLAHHHGGYSQVGPKNMAHGLHALVSSQYAKSSRQTKLSQRSGKTLPTQKQLLMTPSGKDRSPSVDYHNNLGKAASRQNPSNWQSKTDQKQLTANLQA